MAIVGKCYVIVRSSIPGPVDNGNKDDLGDSLRPNFYLYYDPANRADSYIMVFRTGEAELSNIFARRELSS